MAGGVNSDSIRRFLQNLHRANDKVKKAALSGMDEFAEKVLADSNEMCPVSPTDPKHSQYIGTSGALRDSGSAEPAEINDGKITARVIYNTNYAAAVHDRMDLNHQYPGRVNEHAQDHFLAKSINKNRDKFLPHMADKVNGALQ